MAETQEFQDYIELGADVDQDSEGWDGSQMEFPSYGDHTFEIIAAEKEPSSKGTPMAKLSFEVVGGEEAGRRINGWYPLTAKARGRIINVCNAVGVRLDERGGFSLGALVGTRLMASVTENVYTKVNPVTQQKEEKVGPKVMFEKPLPSPAKGGKASERVQGRR